MQARNKLVHSGVFEQTYESVLKKLYVVEYMLHRFDYCLGFDMAISYAERIKKRVDTKHGDDV